MAVDHVTYYGLISVSQNGILIDAIFYLNKSRIREIIIYRGNNRMAIYHFSFHVKCFWVILTKHQIKKKNFHSNETA